MNVNPRPAEASAKRSTNLTLRLTLVQEARALDINLSAAAEDGIARAVAKARDARWMQRNRQAMASYDTFVEREGLLLEDSQNILADRPARLEVWRLKGGRRLAPNVQSDLLRIATFVVVPLARPGSFDAVEEVNPEVEVAGRL